MMTHVAPGSLPYKNSRERRARSRRTCYTNAHESAAGHKRVKSRRFRACEPGCAGDYRPAPASMRAAAFSNSLPPPSATRIPAWRTIGPPCGSSNGAIAISSASSPTLSRSISLNPRSRLQHFQRPTPSHLSKNAPSLQGHGTASGNITRSTLMTMEGLFSTNAPTFLFRSGTFP
jgi:hypothetical protein